MITTCIPNSAKQGFLEGLYLAAHNYYMALFYDTGSLSLGPTTTAYAATGEVSGIGYTAGGKLLTTYASGNDSNGGWIDFADPSWGPTTGAPLATPATFVASGAMIYDSSASNAAIAIWSFGSNQTVSAGTFTVTLPVAAGLTGLIHLN